MISIGAVALSDHLLIPSLKNIQRRMSSTRYTMNPGGGRPYIQSMAMLGGQSIQLVDDGDYGLFSGSQIDAINVYKSTGESVVFVHHLGSWLVIVTDVEVEQADGLADPTNDDTYFGTITMQIIG